VGASTIRTGRVVPAPDGVGLVEPGRTRGLLDVVRHRYLLRLLVRRELRARYHGSLLGMGWSYVQPAVQFCVYFFVVGMFLGVNRRIEHFPIHLFSGMVLVHFFNETLSSTTRSVMQNKALVRKIHLPREMFPVASLLVSAVHFVPGLVILLVGVLVLGWSPSPAILGAALLGFAVVAVFGMAVGLMFSAFNVFFRDFQKVVEVTTIVITWSVPMIYPLAAVHHAFGGAWPEHVYMANPLVSAVTLFQWAFWLPTTTSVVPFPPHLFWRGGVVLLASLALVAVAQVAFARLQNRFAQEL